MRQTEGRIRSGWLAAAGAVALLAGCADYTNQQALDDPEAEADSLESFNRAMYGVHTAVDGVVIRPVTFVYRSVVPESGRTMVSNFLRNLASPISFANSVLQGDVDNSFGTFWRFAINSTIGIGGLFDVADEAGLRHRDNDFGQTLAVWGVGSGSYLFLPVLGPGTGRDTLGRAVDMVFNPLTWAEESWPVYVQGGMTVIDRRSANYTLIEDISQTSLDPYATFRSGYLQRRTVEIKKARAASPLFKNTTAPVKQP